MTRDGETRDALGALGHMGAFHGAYVVSPYDEGNIDADHLAEYLAGMVPEAEDFQPLADPPDRRVYDLVFAPAIEEGGHDDHNAVGRAALLSFGAARVVSYFTYTRHGGRTRDQGTEVPATPEMIQRKLRALACHRSQIEHPARRPWFYDMLDMREWLA